MTEDVRLSRSFQTAPVAVPQDDSAKYLRSGFTRDGFESPDWLVPDIEDGTAPRMKEEGLQNIVDLVTEYGPDFEGEIWPRIQWSYDDDDKHDSGREEIRKLVHEVGEYITGFVVPKVGWLEDVQRAESIIAEAEQDAGLDEGAIEQSCIIETARAKSDLREIARFGRNSRLHGLVFGPVDYTAELGGREIGGSRATWTGLVEDLSNETSANDLVGIGGPFDQIFRDQTGVTVYNADAYADNAEREAQLGLDGSWSLHPNQTIQANRIHMPTTAELESDVEKTEAFLGAKAEGTGAILVDGQMIDEGTLRTFINTIRTVAAIHERNPDQTEAAYDEGLLDRALSLAEEI